MRVESVARWRRFSLGALLVLAAAACASEPELDLPVTLSPPSIATATPPAVTLGPAPPETLFICLGREPQSLYRFSSEYLYGGASRQSEAVLEAIYDGPFDILGYSYRPVILEKLPSLADGDARVVEVTVATGEVYFNPRTMLPANLALGDPYLPAGCRDTSCVRTYGGGGVAMDQLQVDFRLLADLTWSDGQPLLASDSVFAFSLDRHIDTPTPKVQVDRTASYAALDERTVRWTGIAGYMDSEYYANFWSPLPQHHLEDYSPAELLQAPEANLAPLGWGPYQVEEWIPGRQLTLVRNPNYFRSAEGLPGFDQLIYRFLQSELDSSIEQLLTGECDVLDEAAVIQALDVESLDPSALQHLLQLQEQGGLVLAWAAGAEMERLDFNLSPYPPGSFAPIFGDARTRQGIAGCLDRQAMVEELLFDLSAVPASYLPPDHPLALADIDPGLDLSAAVGLLQSAGWVDSDGDPGTPSIASGVSGVANGTSLSFRFLTGDEPAHRAIAERIQADLARCGVQVMPEYLPREQLFQEWPDGPVFGRGFQTAGWAWPGWVSPLCEMFISAEIPSATNTLGINASGFQSSAYDLACGRLLLGLPEDPSYAQAVRDTQTLFSEQLPALPLFMRPRLVAHRPEICGVAVDATAFSAFWNIESFQRGSNCSQGG